MNNNILENGETGVKLHLADSPGLPTARRREPKPEPTNPFSVELRGYFQTAAMSQAEFAEVLSLELGRTVSQVSLSTWLNGATPRTPGKAQTRATTEPLANAVLTCAKRIADNESAAGRQKYADPQEVQAQFQRWDEQGYTPKQIQLAAEISVSLYRSWRFGGVRVRAERWNQAVTKVEAFLKFLAEYKAKNASS